jgi:hypothetical protein
MEEACGPLSRIKARAETPGGVAQAAMVSFSKAIGFHHSKNKERSRVRNLGEK